MWGEDIDLIEPKATLLLALISKWSPIYRVLTLCLVWLYYGDTERIRLGLCPVSLRSYLLPIVSRPET